MDTIIKYEGSPKRELLSKRLINGKPYVLVLVFCNYCKGVPMVEEKWILLSKWRNQMEETFVTGWF